MNRDDVPIVRPARYARGQMAVQCGPVRESDPKHFQLKSRCARLCEALRGRWSGRENAYIMSPTKAMKLQKLYNEGWNARFVTLELVPPK